MKVRCLQWNSDWQDSQANLDRLEEWMRQYMPKERSVDSSASVLVLPELFTSGFSMKPEQFSEPLQGVVTTQLSKLAMEYHCYLIAGVAVDEKGAYRNSALVFNPDGVLLSHYIKQRSFSYAGENLVYQSGEKTALYEIEGVICASFICYDLRFPELFRAVAKSAEVIFVIANWPGSRQSHWEALLKARAIENQCFIVGVNRIGTDGNNLTYIGGSMVVNPLGDVIVYASKVDESIDVDLPIDQVKETRTAMPFLQDMFED